MQCAVALLLRERGEAAQGRGVEASERRLAAYVQHSDDSLCVRAESERRHRQVWGVASLQAMCRVTAGNRRTFERAAIRVDGMRGEQVTHARGIWSGQIEERVQQRADEVCDLRRQHGGESAGVIR